MINIDNITFSYGNNVVLKNITMHLEEGRIYGLLGENGVGYAYERGDKVSLSGSALENRSGRNLRSAGTPFKSRTTWATSVPSAPATGT